MAIAICVAASLGVLWALKTLRPEQHLRADILTLQGTVDALEAQVTKLRTRKAGQRSAERHQAQAVAPEFEGLSEEEVALFQ